MSSKVQVPPTTNSIIVFPLDKKTNTYNSAFYSPGLTNGRVNSDEISQVLAQAANIWQPHASKKRCSQWIAYLIMLVVWLIILGAAQQFFSFYPPLISTIILAIVIVVIILSIVAGIL